MREVLGNGQYRLDRICSKSGYTTSTVKPAYDLYGVSKEEPEDTPKKKSVSWSDEVHMMDKEELPPAPTQSKPANDMRQTRTGLQRGRDPIPPRRTRPTLPSGRPIPPAPGRATDCSPQEEFGYMVL